MKKLILCLLLILAMTLSLAACDKKNKKKDKTTTVPTTTTATTTAPANSDAVTYAEAMAKIAAGEFEEAYELLVSLGDYGDAAAQADRFLWVPVTGHYTDGEEAASVTVTLGADGLPTRFLYVEEDEDEVWEDLYELTWNEDNKLILERNTWDDSESTTTYTYDAKGRLATSARMYNGEYFQTLTYTYDEQDRLIRRVSSESGLTFTYEWEYNAQGLVSKETYTNGSDDVQMQTYTYNAAGNVTSEIWTDGVNTFTVTYTYDASGERLLEKNDGALHTYTYAAKGHPILLTHVDPDKGDSTETYTYDDEGRVLTEVYTSGGYVDTYVYTYDTHGNVIGYVNTYDEYTDVYTFTYRLIYVPEGLTVEEIEELFYDYMDV